MSRDNTTQNLYLESLIKLLVCRLDHLVIREDCEADASGSVCVCFDRNGPHIISQELTSSAGLWTIEILFGPSSVASLSDLAGDLL